MKTFDTIVVDVNYASPDGSVDVAKAIRHYIRGFPPSFHFRFNSKREGRAFIECSGYPIEVEVLEMISGLVQTAIAKAHEERFPLLRKLSRFPNVEQFYLNDYHGYQSVKKKLKAL